MASSSRWPQSGTFPTDQQHQYDDSFAASLAAVRSSIGGSGLGMATAPDMSMLHHQYLHPSMSGAHHHHHHHHLHHPASYKPPSLYSLDDRHLASAQALNPQRARMESLLDAAALSSSLPRHPSSVAAAAASYFTSHQYTASHAASSHGSLPPLSTASPAYLHHSAHRLPPSLPANLDAEAMKYLAQSAAAKAATEMARAEGWARASMLAEAARTEASSLLPPSRLSYGGLNGSGVLLSAMANNPYSSLHGSSAGMHSIHRSMDGVDGGRMTTEDMRAARRYYNNTMGNEASAASAPIAATAPASSVADPPRASAISVFSAPPIADSPQSGGHSTTLSLPTDHSFLNEAQCLTRSSCIELFVSTKAHASSPGKGARPCKEGQVGFRCAHCRHIPRREQAKQAVCYPSKRENIFEGVRNFQRVHMEECAYIPVQIKEAFQRAKRVRNPKRSQKLVRAYYAQAASEVGLVDSLHGLEYEDKPYDPNAAPSEKLLRILQAAESSESTNALLEETAHSICIKKDKQIEIGKFEHVATESTRCVLVKSRKETSSPFVFSHDYPGVADYVWLLFHQLEPCTATAAAFKRRGLKLTPNHNIPGLCCKYCSRVSKKEKKPQTKGMYFPLNVESLGDSSFSQTLLMHLMGCPNVPGDVKKAFTELKILSDEHRVSTKRGAKRRFMEKVWGRIETYYSKRKPKEQLQKLTSIAEGEP